MRRREFILTASAAVLPPAGELVIVKDGRSSYSIEMPEDAIPAERHAAEELQRFLEQMSGCRLPVVTAGAGRARGRIVLRYAQEHGVEGFALRTDGKDIVIEGGRTRGVMYGAYAFLEKLGCRWFTQEVTRIPRRDTIRIGRLDEVQKPAFEYRNVYITEAFEKNWCARNRLNGGMSGLDESVGGCVKYFPHVHSFYAMVPPKKYFADHPEYFSLVDGRRRDRDAQLCLSNPDVLRVSLESVFRWIHEHPDASIISVSQNDDEGPFAKGPCECDACRRIEEEEGGAHSGLILRFVNAIAAEVEKEYPGKLIDTLAYNYSEAPPANVRPRRNVRVRMCPISVCHAHPYEQCEQNAAMIRNLHGWAKVTNQLYIWHYIIDFSDYLLPFPDFDELAADLPMYRRNGVVGLFLQGPYAKGGGGDHAEMRAYVMARLLWDTGANVSAAVDEFLAGVYGAGAARPLRAWFDLLHEQVRRPPRGAGQHMWTYCAPRLPDAVLRRGAELFRKAEAEAPDEAARARVRKARLPLDYATLVRAKTFGLRGSIYGPENLPALNDRFNTFMAAAKQHGITELHEWRKLEDDERQFRELVKEYEAVVLASGTARAVIVPGLNGRVVSLKDQRTGREALRQSRPEEFGYPARGGTFLDIYPGADAADPLGIAWKVVNAGGDSAILHGACEGGLAIERRFRFERGRLTAQTMVRNESPDTRELAVLLQAEYGAPEAVLRSTGRDGREVSTTLLPPGEMGSGEQRWAAGDLGSGELRIDGGRDGATLTVAFPREFTARCVAKWIGRGQDTATFQFWTRPLKLEPGATLSFDTACAAT